MDVEQESRAVSQDISTYITPELRRALLLPPPKDGVRATRSQTARQQAAAKIAEVDWTDLPALRIPDAYLYTLKQTYPTIEKYYAAFGLNVAHYPVMQHFGEQQLPFLLMFSEEVLATLASVPSILYPSDHVGGCIEYIRKFLQAHSGKENIAAPFTVGQVMADTFYICYHAGFQEASFLLDECRAVIDLVRSRMQASNDPALKAAGAAYLRVPRDPYDDEKDYALPSEMDMDGGAIKVTRIPAPSSTTK